VALAVLLGLTSSACQGPNPAFQLRGDGPAERAPAVDGQAGRDDRPPAPDGGGFIEAGADAHAGDLASTMDGVGTDGPLADAPVDARITDGSLPPDLVDAPTPTVDVAPPDVTADLPPDAGVLACPDDSDLVLCLRFENQAVDESRSRLPMTVSGLSFEVGPDGQAGRFASQTRVLVQPSSLLDVSGLTLEARINPRLLPTTATRMGIVDYTREYDFFLHPNGELSCVVVTSSGVQTLRVTALVQAQVWQSVACTFDGSRLAVWRNGVQLGMKTINPLAQSASTDSLVIGGNFAASSPDPFDGAMDNVRVWKRARSPSELCAGATPPCP
jgi:hypothetical protein